MQGQTTIVLALVVAGVTLATLGALRLVRKGFLAMPLRVAIACVGGGLLVVGFAIFLLLSAPTDDNSTQGVEPLATLQPMEEVDEREPGRGLSGRIVDLDGDPVSGVEISLDPQFDENAKRAEQRSNDEGRFAFKEVEVNPGSPYAVLARYDEGLFSTRVYRGPADDIEIVVTKTTREPAEISISSESLALVGDKSGAQAVHVITVKNSGKRAFTGLLQFPFLEGAQSIQEGGELDRRNVFIRDDHMVHSKPILPGSHEFSYTYFVQMPKDGLAFSRTITTDTARYELLVGGDLDIERIEGVEAAADVELGAERDKRNYRRAMATDLDADDTIRAKIVVAEPTPVALIAGGVVVALVAIAIVVVPLIRRRAGTQTEEEDGLERETEGHESE